VTSVPIAKAIARSVNTAAEPVVTVLWAEQSADIWRQHQCDDPEKMKLRRARVRANSAKERAGQSTLQRDGSVDRGHVIVWQ